MSTSDKKAAVIAVLEECGFRQTGRVSNPGIVVVTCGMAIGGKYSHREKFRRDNIGCTVGARTTCIYSIDPKEGPHSFRNYRTGDLAQIKAAIVNAIWREPVDRNQTLYQKFNVSRKDGRDQPGGDREGAEYFTLDLTNDPHAPAALLAYADACEASNPALAAAIRNRKPGGLSRS